MSKKSKKDKDKSKDYYQEQNHNGYYNPNMQNPYYNPNMQNMNYNSNMQNPYYNQGYNGAYSQGYNQNYNQNPGGQTDLSSLMNLLNNIDVNQLMGMLSQMNLNQQNQGGNAAPNMDQAYNLLNSLRPFMPAERINMVEQVLNNMNSDKK